MTPAELDEMLKPDQADCPACLQKRCHTQAEWKTHPLAGHGFSKETGWTGGLSEPANVKSKAELIPAGGTK